MIATFFSRNIGIPPYWLMLAIGTVGMMICLLQRRTRFSLSTLQCAVFTLLLTVVGFSGAKLLYILENIQDTLENGLSLGGVSFFGSVYLIPLMMPLVGMLFRLRPRDTMDICGPCVAIMIGCMRFGCVLSGCCGGWEACFGSICFTWPTQGMESICDFTILIFLLQRETDGVHRGSLYPLFMLLYSVIRFFIEFLRDTPKDWLLLSHGQWFSIAAVFVALIWLWTIRRAGSVKQSSGTN